MHVWTRCKCGRVSLPGLFGAGKILIVYKGLQDICWTKQFPHVFVVTSLWPESQNIQQNAQTFPIFIDGLTKIFLGTGHVTDCPIL